MGFPTLTIGHFPNGFPHGLYIFLYLYPGVNDDNQWHIHIYIYIYIWLCLKKNSSYPSVSPLPRDSHPVSPSFSPSKKWPTAPSPAWRHHPTSMQSQRRFWRPPACSISVTVSWRWKRCAVWSGNAYVYIYIYIFISCM